jgi:ABC-type lipoprotein export system ATPase subunit
MMNITLQDIEVRLPNQDKPLFRLPHFAIPAGQKILLQGESGRGKTTLLHLIAGLFYPERGTVEVGDVRFNSLSVEARCAFRRKNIGIIFQKLNLLEHLTALENVLLATTDTDRALAALKAVGLESLAHARSSVMSLGEQQRVAVARVLAGGSSIILADEPTSSLDQKNADRVMDLLFAAAEGKTLLVVSHDQRIEKRFAQRVDFLKLVGA